MSRSRRSDATSSLRLGPFRCQFTGPLTAHARLLLSVCVAVVGLGVVEPARLIVFPL
jgi:hypothetical protein